MVGRSFYPLFLGLKQTGLLQMDQPRASRWRGCVHSSQGQKQALQLNKSSSGQIKLFPCHTAYNSIPSLLKEIYPLNYQNVTPSFPQICVQRFPEVRKIQPCFLASMSTLRKLFSYIILLLSGYSHLHFL